jgi:GntR family transcriptional regulator, transcriptional repressor for pyruvate dehydrogenase complex
MPRASRPVRPHDGVGAERVVDAIRAQIERGSLKRGDQLPPERELAQKLGVSRPTVRAGLRSLVTMGVLESRHGFGTFITDRPPALGSDALRLLAALHGFTAEQMAGARRVLDAGIAGVAAECATATDLAALSEEVTGMFASLENRSQFAAHEARFRAALGAAAKNPVLAALADMIPMPDRRDGAAERGRDLKEQAQACLRLYQAIRAKDGAHAATLVKESSRT